MASDGESTASWDESSAEMDLRDSCFFGLNERSKLLLEAHRYAHSWFIAMPKSVLSILIAYKIYFKETWTVR